MLKRGRDLKGVHLLEGASLLFVLLPEYLQGKVKPGDRLVVLAIWGSRYKAVQVVNKSSHEIRQWPIIVILSC